MKSTRSRSPERHAVRQRSTSAPSKTDWARLNSAAERGGPCAEHPEADFRHISFSLRPSGLRASPVAGTPAMMRDGKNGHRSFDNFVVDGIRKAMNDPMPVVICVRGPAQRRGGNGVDHIENRRAECVGDEQVAFAIPGERCGNVVLGGCRYDDVEIVHNALKRALASAHGADAAAPDRRSALRWRISSAQALVTLASSSPSRLSSKATMTAERSSAPSCRASFIRWSTRAFMRRSLPAAMRNRRREIEWAPRSLHSAALRA